MHDPAKRLDHQAAIGLLVVAGAHLPDLALEVEQRAGESKGGAPLAGAGLRGELLHPSKLVVVRLRNSRVGLVAARRAHPFVLVIDVCRRAERLLEAVGAEQRRRPPLAIHVKDGPGDVDVAVLGDLLQDQVHREERSEVVGSRWLERSGVKGRRWRLGQVRHDVVPGRRHLGLVEQDLVLADGLVHGVASRWVAWPQDTQAVCRPHLAPRSRPTPRRETSGPQAARLNALGRERTRSRPSRRAWPEPTRPACRR